MFWEKVQFLSVANVIRHGGIDFRRQVPEMGSITQKPSVRESKRALADLRGGHSDGAPVLLFWTRGLTQTIYPPKPRAKP